MLKDRSQALIIIGTVLLFVILSGLFLDKIVAVYIDTFTPYKITYTRWGTPLNRMNMNGMTLLLKKQGVTVTAEKVSIAPYWRVILREKAFKAHIHLKDVKLAIKGEEGTGSSGTDYMNMLSPPGHVYKSVDLVIKNDADTFEVSSFKAVSDSISVTGECVLYKEEENISLDFKISVSRDMYNKLASDIRDKLLSPDGDRYSTVINYKGNVTLLRALYSLF